MPFSDNFFILVWYFSRVGNTATHQRRPTTERGQRRRWRHVEASVARPPRSKSKITAQSPGRSDKTWQRIVARDWSVTCMKKDDRDSHCLLPHGAVFGTRAAQFGTWGRRRLMIGHEWPSSSTATGRRWDPSRLPGGSLHKVGFLIFAPLSFDAIAPWGPILVGCSYRCLEFW